VGGKTMSSILRVLVLLAAVVLIFVAVPTVRPPFEHALQTGLDYFDKRPATRVLIIGNSRTYYHDMPFMVREIADSAHSPVRYVITTLAWGGASFEEMWKDSEVQGLLRRRWDQVVLQAESRAHLDAATNSSFQTYGEKLISAAASSGSPVALIVNWGYGESAYVGLPQGNRERYIAFIETNHRALAARTGASLIETCEVWEEVHAAEQSLPLWEDGNHPTIDGSYLSALMIYGFLSEDGVGKATFRPGGVDEKAARIIKGLVAQHYGNGPG
jgi:hypothetical protein